MNFQTATTEKACPNDEIAAYIDGELSPREELELEMHFAGCRNCRSELNEQKKLLCALDFALEHEKEIELPANFTKVIVTNAESAVSGLRCARERLRALFVCLILFLPTVLFFSGETQTIVNSFRRFGEQILAVGSFTLHLIFDIAVGTAIISRSLSHQFNFSSFIWLVLLIGLPGFLLLTFSRLNIGNNRT